MSGAALPDVLPNQLESHAPSFGAVLFKMVSHRMLAWKCHNFLKRLTVPTSFMSALLCHHTGWISAG